MTVCAAMICDQGKSIATASDMAVSTDYFSADVTTFKADQIADTWWAFFAGNDITSVQAIMREAAANFSRRSENTIDQMLAAFKEAYRVQLQGKIVEKVLGRFGLDLQTFVQNGLKLFGRDRFNSICQDIQIITLDCDFLVCGFDRHDAPHIFSVHPPGDAMEHTKPGFYAIGSGTMSALSALYFHNVNIGVPLCHAIYHICEAKFMAESASGVGKSTVCFVLHSDGMKPLKREMVDKIKLAWMKEGRPKAPQSIVDEINLEFPTRSTYPVKKE